jgi:hypothetical protein
MSTMRDIEDLLRELETELEETGTVTTPKNPQVYGARTPVIGQRSTLPGSWIIEAGGGGGGGGVGGQPAPPVTIDPVADIIFRNDHKVEIDVTWTKAASATPQNFSGVFVYLEDPDISSGSENPDLGNTADGNTTGAPLDGSTQVSGNRAPVHINDSVKTPAVVPVEANPAAVRNVRIYLAAYGPGYIPTLVRATDPNPTPNIMVTVPTGPTSGGGGMEWAFLVSNPSVEVQTDYHRPDPQYYLIFKYDPPDPTATPPPGMNKFGGVRIVWVYYDAAGNPQFPGTDSAIDVPVAQASTGYKSPALTPVPWGGKFRNYFCSEDDSIPLGKHINTLIDGVTPWADAVVPAVPSAPDVGDFTIDGQKSSSGKLVWRLSGSFVAQAQLAWNLPTTADKVRYAGVFIYLVNVTGATPPLTDFPKALTGAQSNSDTSFFLDISDVPANPETWTLAAISVDNNGVLAEPDLSQFTLPGGGTSHSPTVTWNIGPPGPGGLGSEFAPKVTIDAGATATPTESLSTDGVGMVSFDVGTWTNPSDNQFGGAQVAMVIATQYDPANPNIGVTYWSVPNGATSFVTPTMPSFGNIGAKVPVDFYIVSDDPQGHKNSLVPGTGNTPVIHYIYTPSEGAVIPARSGWFDPKQFAWDTSAGGFQAQTFSASVIQVGKTLVVGGAPASFGGSDNGQIAVMDSTGKLLDWLGEQQPGQGSGAPLWGAWLGQVWIGGSNPLDAPVFVDNQGIIEVGGIVQPGTSKVYPYISVRDDHGYEMGRIGAKLNVPAPTGSSGTLGGVGPNPPAQLTAGAWFTQLAIGGSNISNWCVLVVPDPNNALGSQVQIRNVNLFQIDYLPQQGIPGVSPGNPEYQLKMGNSVWSGANAPQGSYVFPGTELYQIDGIGNAFGATYISRGMVLRGPNGRGTPNAPYPVLVSLVTYNGQPSGSDDPPDFWGELAMYSPYYSPSVGAYRQTVYLSSGGANQGSAFFRMLDRNGGYLFQVNQVGDTVVGGALYGAPNPNTGASNPVTAYALGIKGYTGSDGTNTVIDSQGNWKGVPMAGIAQSPWTVDINGAGHTLSNVGSVSVNTYLTASEFRVNSGSGAVINSSGTFMGAGVNCGYDIRGTSLSTLYPDNATWGELDVGLIRCANNIVASNSVNPTTLTGTGWLVGDYIASVNSVGCASVDVSGHEVINTNGAFTGSGIDITLYGTSGTGGIGCYALESYVNPNQPGTGYVIGDAYVLSKGIVYGNVYRMWPSGLEVINPNGAFVGAGAAVDVNNGIKAGYLEATAGGTGGGVVACATLNCTGLVSCGGINLSGILSAMQFNINNPGYFNGPVIDGYGQFVGPNISTGHVTCNYINNSGGNIDNVGTLSAGGELHSNVCRSASYVVCAGWAVMDPDHNVFFNNLYANNWQGLGGQPVIDSGGVFHGPGILIGDNGVGCGYLSTHYAANGQGGIDTGYINALADITSNGVMVAYGGFNTSGGTVINGDGVFVGNGFNVPGQCFVGSTVQAGAYYGGDFRGNGVNCPDYGIAGAGFNPYYGGQYYGGTFFGGDVVTIQTSAGPISVRIIGGVLANP